MPIYNALRSIARKWPLAIIGLLVFLLLIVWAAGRVDLSGDDPNAIPSGFVTTGNSADASADRSAESAAGIGTIRTSSLPPQAKATIALIAKGGPYPYRQDDSVFTNREGILPKHSRGYYREYTVATPGSDDRGARRIIRARDGTLYYTSDHYESFRRVVP